MGMTLSSRPSSASPPQAVALTLALRANTAARFSPRGKTRRAVAPANEQAVLQNGHTVSVIRTWR